MKTIPFSTFTFTFGILIIGLASLPIACNSTDGVPSDVFRAVGAACAYDWQCAAYACSAEPGRESCGVCLDVRRLGEPCDGPLLTCSGTAVCSNGICQSTKKTTGEPCKNYAKGGSDDCDADFFCAGYSMGVCTAKPVLGEACTSDYQRKCAGVGHCERGVCVPPREGALGDSCDQRPCMKNLACHWAVDGRTCEEPNVIPFNHSCSYDDYNWECEKGTSCERTGEPQEFTGYYPKACLPDKTEGEECATSRCAEGLNCEKREGEAIYTCHRLGLDGENCQSFWDCSAGLECLNGSCLAACN